MTKPSLRAAMPLTAEFIDRLRDAFGAETINTEIRKGMAGLPDHFHAREAGHEAGTPFIARQSVSLADVYVKPSAVNAKK